MFYPVKIYSSEEIKEYAKKSGNIVSSKVKDTKKGKIISTKKLNKQYWNEFEEQEEEQEERKDNFVEFIDKDEKQSAVLYDDTYYK